MNTKKKEEGEGKRKPKRKKVETALKSESWWQNALLACASPWVWRKARGMEGRKEWRKGGREKG